MRKFILLALGMLVTATSFAMIPSKGMTGMSNAWHNQQSIHPKQNKNDITIVYGGQDVSNRPSLSPYLTTA